MTDNPNSDLPLAIVLEKLNAAATLPFDQAHPIERNLWRFNKYLARVRTGDR